MLLLLSNMFFMTPKNKKLAISTGSWAFFLGFTIYVDHYQESWDAKHIVFGAVCCILFGVAITLLFRFVGRMVGGTVSDKAAAENRPTPQSSTSSDKLIDFIATTIFLTLINYYYLGKIFADFKTLQRSFLIATAAAFILALYRQKIKGFIKNLFKKAG